MIIISKRVIIGLSTLSFNERFFITLILFFIVYNNYNNKCKFNIKWICFLTTMYMAINVKKYYSNPFLIEKKAFMIALEKVHVQKSNYLYYNWFRKNNKLTK
jgi:hypothetical protein